MATQRQVEPRRRRLRQLDHLINLLKTRSPEYVDVPEILDLGIYQYNARVGEARGLGYRIEAKPGGGAFRLVTRPAIAATAPTPTPTPNAEPTEQPVSLFGDLQPIERHRDDG